MRYVNILGLALVAGLAAMAFVGAGSATAAIDLCLWELAKGTNPFLNAEGCKEVGGTIHTENEKVTFTAKATKPEIKGNLNQVCNESNMTFQTKGDGTPGFEITALSFTGNCKPCSSVTTFAPYSGEISEVSGVYFMLWKGSVKLNGCFGVTCKFGTEKISLKLALGTNMASNEFRAEGEIFNLEEGSKFLCGQILTLTANYVVSNPSHWFFFLL